MADGTDGQQGAEQKGTGQEGGKGGGGTAVLDWHPHIPADVLADESFKPIIEKITEKDVPSLIKSHLHLSRKMGSAIHLPGKDAKPEELAAIRQRVYESGIIAAPPASPADYKIAKPEKLPDGVGWNDKFAGQLAETLHKHGVPAAAVPDLLALHESIVMGTQQALKVTYDEGMAELRREHGDKFDERQEMAKRMLPILFQKPEELAVVEAMGLGNHPGFMGIIMRLAPYAVQDSSFMERMQHPGGELTGDQVRQELSDIMSNKENPKYALYWKNDPDTMRYVDGLYKKAYGTKPVELGAGISQTIGKE